MIRKIEETRRLFSFRWNKLVFQTGTIVLSLPTFRNIIHGLLIKICLDSQRNINNFLKIDIKEPYFTYTHSFEKTKAVADLENTFASFMDYFWEKQNDIENQYNLINQLYLDAKKFFNYKLLFRGIKLTKEEL